MSLIKVASVAMHSVLNNISYNIIETKRLLLELDAQNVQFALFPELNILGYSLDLEVVESFFSAEQQVVNELIAISKGVDVAFAVGFPVREDNDIFIAHNVFFKGKLIFSHRKTHLSPNEKNIYTEGDAINTFKIYDYTIGIQLCFETHIPELSYFHARSGAEIIAMAFASPHETSLSKTARFLRYLTARAYDNSVFVMACNQSGGSFSKVFLIVNPKGIVLKKSTNNVYCCVEIDKSEVERIKNTSMAWFNNHKRMDLLKLKY